MQEAVHLQADRQPVGGGAGQARALAQLGEPAWLGRRGAEHPHGLVEDPDAARLSHVAILTSRILGY